MVGRRTGGAWSSQRNCSSPRPYTFVPGCEGLKTLRTRTGMRFSMHGTWSQNMLHPSISISLSLSLSLYIYIYIYIHTYVHTYIYIYIYIRHHGRGVEHLAAEVGQLHRLGMISLTHSLSPYHLYYYYHYYYHYYYYCYYYIYIYIYIYTCVFIR